MSQSAFESAVFDFKAIQNDMQQISMRFTRNDFELVEGAFEDDDSGHFAKAVGKIAAIKAQKQTQSFVGLDKYLSLRH